MNKYHIIKIDAEDVKYAKQSLDHGRWASDLAPGEELYIEVLDRDSVEFGLRVRHDNYGKKHLVLPFFTVDNKRAWCKKSPGDEILGEYIFDVAEGRGVHTVKLELR